MMSKLNPTARPFYPPGLTATVMDNNNNKAPTGDGEAPAPPSSPTLLELLAPSIAEPPANPTTRFESMDTKHLRIILTNTKLLLRLYREQWYNPSSNTADPEDHPSLIPLPDRYPLDFYRRFASFEQKRMIAEIENLEPELHVCRITAQEREIEALRKRALPNVGKPYDAKLVGVGLRGIPRKRTAAAPRCAERAEEQNVTAAIGALKLDHESGARDPRSLSSTLEEDAEVAFPDSYHHYDHYQHPSPPLGRVTRDFGNVGRQRERERERGQGYQGVHGAHPPPPAAQVTRDVDYVGREREQAQGNQGVHGTLPSAQIDGPAHDYVPGAAYENYKNSYGRFLREPLPSTAGVTEDIVIRERVRAHYSGVHGAPPRVSRPNSPFNNNGGSAAHKAYNNSYGKSLKTIVPELGGQAAQRASAKSLKVIVAKPEPQPRDG